MKTFTNKECQVIVKAVDGLSRAVKILTNHIRDSFDGETFVHIVEPFEDREQFKDGIYQHPLNKVMSRL